MELQIGKKYKVTVSKIIKVGAIVEMEDGSTELIHISNISNDYVANIEDFVTVGSAYEATCQAGKTKSIELTLRPLNLKSCKHCEKHTESKQEKKSADKLSESSLMQEHLDSLEDMINKMPQEYSDDIRSKKSERYHRKQYYKNKHNRWDY